MFAWHCRPVLGIAVEAAVDREIAAEGMIAGFLCFHWHLGMTMRPPSQSGELRCAMKRSENGADLLTFSSDLRS